MVIYDRSQVAAVEQACESMGITQDRLMENAGSAVAKAIRDRYEIDGKRVLVFCGKGNNGGDGFVAARSLFQSGARVAVVLTDGEPVGACARSKYEYAQSLGLRMIDIVAEPDAFAATTAAADLIVDAIYGIGFRGPLLPADQAVIDRINESPAPVVSIDIPSGVMADTASVGFTAVRAALTVTFFEQKVCHVLYPARAYCGEVVVADIGAPDAAYVPSSLGCIDRESCASLLPERSPDSHKGTFGAVGLVCGSYGMLGAAAIAGEAAARSGVGLVKLAVSQSMYSILASMLKEPVFLTYADGEDRSLSGLDARRVAADLADCDALLVGCGLGRTENSAALVDALLSGFAGPIVLDADGINVAATHMDILDPARGRLILTPHVMEMARLCRVSREELMQNRLYYGRLISERYQAVVVLKDASTIVFSPDGRAWFLTGGNDGMATAGCGDMLAGVIASLAAQGAPLDAVARLGVWLHAEAGALAAQRCSRRGMIVSDMLASLPGVFLSLE